MQTLKNLFSVFNFIQIDLLNIWTPDLFGQKMSCLAELESSRTSLASRTHFEVLGLGLETSNPRKLACPWLENSTIFWFVKILWSTWKIFWKTFFSGDRLKNFGEDVFFLEIAWKIFMPTFFCFWGALALVSLVLGLGLEHSCPWPREGLSSEGLSLSLASDFFFVLDLGLEPCVLHSTSVVLIVYRALLL